MTVGSRVDFRRAPRASGHPRICPGSSPGFIYLGRAHRRCSHARRNLIRLLRGDLTYFAGLQRLVRLFYEAVIEGGSSPTRPSDVYRTYVLLEDVISALQGRQGPSRCDVVVPA